MNWFFRWLDKRCKQAYEDSQVEEKYPEDRAQVGRKRHNTISRVGLSTAGSMDGVELQSQSTTFKMFQANGGTVIELRHYNDSRDQWESSLHVIPSGEDMGKTLEHIITYEALKR
jgi:hypothetical protein